MHKRSHSGTRLKRGGCDRPACSTSSTRRTTDDRRVQRLQHTHTRPRFTFIPRCSPAAGGGAKKNDARVSRCVPFLPCRQKDLFFCKKRHFPPTAGVYCRLRKPERLKQSISILCLPRISVGSEFRTRDFSGDTPRPISASSAIRDKVICRFCTHRWFYCAIATTWESVGVQGTKAVAALTLQAMSNNVRKNRKKSAYLGLDCETPGYQRKTGQS